MTCNCADRTLSPIPIRLCPLVTTFFRERVFKTLNIVSVPREEQPRIVDLLVGLKNEGTENAERTLMLRSICKYTKSEPNELSSTEGQYFDGESSHTIVVRAVFVYWWDQRNVGRDRWLQSEVVGKSSKALGVTNQHRE